MWEHFALRQRVNCITDNLWVKAIIWAFLLIQYTLYLKFFVSVWLFVPAMYVFWLKETSGDVVICVCNVLEHHHYWLFKDNWDFIKQQQVTWYLLVNNVQITWLHKVPQTFLCWNLFKIYQPKYQPVKRQWTEPQNGPLRLITTLLTRTWIML